MNIQIQAKEICRKNDIITMLENLLIIKLKVKVNIQDTRYML